MIFIYAGIVGSGKTLRAVCDSLKYEKLNCKIYANQYIEGTFILPDNWFDFRYEEGSLLIIDEAQLKYNCRDYSNKQRLETDKKILEYLTMCRHYGVDILFITQSLSRLDVQIRELATLVYRFKKTIKIPWLNLRKFKIQTFPILQIGRVFNDSVELDHYLNSTSNPNDYGRLYLAFVNPKALGRYDTHIIDKSYMDRMLAPCVYHEKKYYKGVIVNL